MTDAIPTLVKLIFQKESLNDCSLDELQNTARQYSYFTPVQLLLVEKLRSVDENMYAEELQKLSLHFSNPLWLDYLLNGYKAEMVMEPINTNDIRDEIISFEEGHGRETTEEINTRSEPRVPEQVEDTVNETQNEHVDSFGETAMITENHVHFESLHEEINVQSESETPGEVGEVVNQWPNENVNLFEETTIADGGAGNIETSNEEIDKESESGTTMHVEEMVNEPKNENVHFADETAASEEKPGNMSPDTEFIEPGVAESGETQISITGLPELNQEPVETEVLFEPYHTVDYFASQGIKFVPEEKPVDRFGQQLKSFTEWLKTMKRLPQIETTKISEHLPDEKVQELADHSISEDEVVTETMAEVWLKQGNKEKAIETYNKLSLHNPGKSAYFASLIEQLKES